jgi:hypothetical protein
VDTHPAAAARAAEGWAALRAFFAEGDRHLAPAVAAFEEAEQILRRPGSAPGGDSADFDAVLIGLSIALRLRRSEGDLGRAVVLVQQLLNVVRRRSGEAAAAPLRFYLEDAYRDLAEHARGDDAVRAVEEGVAASDRTLALARRFHVDAAVPHARAAKALLLRRRAALRPGPDAPGWLREADRLAASALEAWPARDAAGRASFEADLAVSLVDGPPPRPSAVGRAETLLRQAGRTAPPEDRYLAARLARARARVALAADQVDALDLVAAAVDAFRGLGLERAAQEVERWL